MGLWNLQRNEEDANKTIPLYGASELKAGNNAGLKTSEQGGALVNVLDKYRWTISPEEKPMEGPNFFLIEKQGYQNPIIQPTLFNPE